MKLKKLLKHMPEIARIRIYYGDGKWVNTTAKNVPQELSERKVGYIGAGYFMDRPTIEVSLQKNKKEKDELMKRIEEGKGLQPIGKETKRWQQSTS